MAIRIQLSQKVELPMQIMIASDEYIQHTLAKQLQYQLHAPPRVPARALGRGYRTDLG